MNRFLQAALHYAAVLHWPVFPLRPRQKEPLTEHGCLEATTDKQRITDWWTRYPNANIGLATGVCHWALDVDFKPDKGIDGYQALESLEAKYGKLPPTIEQMTPTGGRHYLFELPDQFTVKNTASVIGPGLDTRGVGGYICGAPSIHPNGKVYAWDGIDHLHHQTMAAAPGWLLERLAAGQTTAYKGPLPDQIPYGKQHKWLFTTGCRMRNLGCEYEEILAALWEMNNRRCQKPGPRKNIETLAKSICSQYAPGTPIREMAEPSTTENGELPWLNATEYIASVGGITAFLNPTKPGDAPSLSLPWAPFNQDITMKPQDFVLLAGMPGNGKTAGALQIGVHNARNGFGVGFASLEMSKAKLWGRVVASAARAELSDIEKSALVESEIQRITPYISALNIPFWIEDQIPRDIEKVCGHVRKLVETRKVDLVIVDHLTRIDGKKKSQYEIVSYSARALKELARSCNIVVLALAQFNRAVAVEGRPPQQSDLRDSGVAEEEADVILATHLPTYHWYILKNRNGPINKHPMTFIGKYQTFEYGFPLDMEPLPEKPKRVTGTRKKLFAMPSVRSWAEKGEKGEED